MSLLIIFLLIIINPIIPLKLHKIYPIYPIISPETAPILKKQPEFSPESLWSRFRGLLLDNLVNSENNNMTPSLRFFWLLLLACLTILILCLILNWLLVFTRYSRLELNQIEKDEKIKFSIRN